MKTKIIYISGNELFDMADIRAAFDEVRNALSLGNDTVLFGVPVDNDDALNATQYTAETVVQPEPKPVIEPVVDDTPEQIVEEVHESEPKKAKVVPISEHIVHNEQKDEEKTNEKPSVVPILSVLGTNSSEQQEPEQTETFIDNIEIETAEPIEEESVKEVAEVSEPETTTEQVTITDIITDDVPEMESEKTLEQLLESMTPLGEDADKKPEPVIEEEVVIEQAIEPSAEQKTEEDDTDITLEKLATEFVASQDKIDTPAKTSARGKIGKLKNILPFKKARHDDSGLMGDLFGWAGVAANDEDFTIPGFFTNATTNPQDNNDK